MWARGRKQRADKGMGIELVMERLLEGRRSQT